MGKQMRQRLDVLAMDLDEFELPDLAVHGLDQRALAHAARAPKQRIVGGKPARKSRVLASSVSRAASMPSSSADGTRLTVLTVKRLCVSSCQKGIACGEIGPLGLARTKPLDGAGDPLEKAGKRFLKVHLCPLQRLSRGSSRHLHGLTARRTPTKGP